MDWDELTGSFHEMTLGHDGRLDSHSDDWQRELAALWRLEMDVNNGGYLQFLANWGGESLRYSKSGLNAMGAVTMHKLIEDCESVLSRVADIENLAPQEIDAMLPNSVVGMDGSVVKQAGSTLPAAVLDRLYELSYQFMDYPEDIAKLGIRHYSRFLNQA